MLFSNAKYCLLHSHYMQGIQGHQNQQVLRFVGVGKTEIGNAVVTGTDKVVN